MVAQYRTLKAAHQGMLLFFRMGDFYELFFEDAVLAAPALDIALTKRGQSGGEPIPMCGVPAHNAELYLHKLIEKGFKVAVCEQIESPDEAKKRKGDKLVRRAVRRIVTPGTLTEEGLLDARRNNYLAAIARIRGWVGLAWADISTGAFFTQALRSEQLGAALSRIDASEILAADALIDDAKLEPVLADWRARLTRLADGAHDPASGERRLMRRFEVESLAGFGAFERVELEAAGALLAYVEITQIDAMSRLAPPKKQESAAFVAMDGATKRNLELEATLGGKRAGSLLDCLDETVTAAGARLLAAHLAAPLASPASIAERQAPVDALYREDALRDDLRGRLKRCPDLERAMARLSLDRGGPRDLAALARGLAVAGDLAALLAPESGALAALRRAFEGHDALVAKIENSLVDDPPLQTKDGGFVREGCDPALDDARALKADGRERVLALEARYRAETGAPSLKIKHNALLGYFVELTAAQRAKAPAHFRQRQSMAAATRFSTDELAELERAIAGAGERALARELAIFADLRRAALIEFEPIGRAAQALAALDLAASHAHLARERAWTKPIVEDGLAFVVRGGRHPVVERALERRGERFRANDADLGEARRLHLLTGPNMAGKSTYLRQNALIAILAQIGAWVPAEEARLGAVDKIFSRVGAADDLARGQSTFMVEMIETAAILHQATPRSLVILDEIGRGTATFDGLSIAWAVVEHLHDRVRCRGLFATHYHELTALAASLERLTLRHMAVKEWRGDVVFLHHVEDGAADRSYGVHVARLAGLPRAVVARAKEVLADIEAQAAQGSMMLRADMPLFAAAAQRRPAPPDDADQTIADDPTTTEPPAIARLRAIEPEELTPRAALDLLFELKAMTDDL